VLSTAGSQIQLLHLSATIFPLAVYGQAQHWLD